MKRLFLPLLLAATLLAGCAGVNPFASVKNPVSATHLYQAELVFAGAVKTFNELKRLCAERVLKPSCRTYVFKGQEIIGKAAAADRAARNFVASNPTLDATNVVRAFSTLVNDFEGNVKLLSAAQ